MRFLLTSQGLSTKEIQQWFLQEVSRLGNKRVAVLYTVKNPGDEKWLQFRKQELSEANLEHDFIDISQKKNIAPSLESYGIVYVVGGNTFYILDCLRKSGGAVFLKKAFKESRELLYVGLSAGSMVMGPNIKTAEIKGSGGDDNDIKLENLAGLGVFDFDIYPHYQPKEIALLEDFFASTDQSVVALADSQAIFIDQEKVIKLLGGPRVLTLGVGPEKINKNQ